jgi:hypothetical protein
MQSGVPDFSRYNIPKREKSYKKPQNVPNVHNIHIQIGRKIDKIAICVIDQHLPLQDLTNFSQILLGKKHLATLDAVIVGLVPVTA